MKTPKFLFKRSTAKTCLFPLSAILLFFAFFTFFPTTESTANAAETDPDDGITVTTSDNITFDSVHSGDVKITKNTVSVSSSAAYGYKLYLSTDSVAHQSISKSNANTVSKIEPTPGTFDNPSMLTNNTWGYALAGQGGFDEVYDTTSSDENSKFAAIPLVDNKQLIHSTTSATSNDDIDIYYGIKVDDSIESGKYETLITYTAVASEAPATAKAIFGDNDNLNLVYDNKTYKIGDVYSDNLSDEVAIIDVREIDLDSGYRSISVKSYSPADPTSINIDASFAAARPTNLSGWFYDFRKVNSITNLQNLNTSQVTDMSWMFCQLGLDYSVKTFDIDVSSWDVSNVTDMSHMFKNVATFATTWNITGLDKWDISNVTNMESTFEGANYKATTWGLNGIENWDVSNVVNMHMVFFTTGEYVQNLNLDLSNWNVGNVTDMGDAFGYFGKYSETLNLNLSNWDTSNVSNMGRMFYWTGINATSFNISGLSGWNTGSVTDMHSMFESTGEHAENWDIEDLDNWNTSNVTDMSKMFDHSGYYTTGVWNIGVISNWDTSNVTNMDYMFDGAGKYTTNRKANDLSGWNVDKVQSHKFFSYHDSITQPIWVR